MSKYEMDTFLTKLDRIVLYGFFILCVIGTFALYRSFSGEVWLSRLALGGTITVFAFAFVAWMNARIVKKYNRNIDRIEDEAVEAVRQLTQRPAHEATFISRGESMPLADAIGTEF